MTERVGFIGLGRMGAAMAANLAAGGISLTVYNRTASVAQAFAADHGVVAADDPAALAAASDIVITMLADDVALRDIMTGERGLLAGLPSGSLVIDMGTSGRAVILELAPKVAARGARLIDAPVSGVPKVASEGRLLIMAAGDEADVRRAEPVVAMFSERVIHVGEVGAGAAMKLSINSAIHGLNQALSEALVMAERAGIDRTTAYEVFASGALSGPFVINRRAVFEQPGVGPQPFSVELAAKDVRLAIDLAADVGASLEQAELNRTILQRAAAAGYADLDESAVAEFLRNAAESTPEQA